MKRRTFIESLVCLPILRLLPQVKEKHQFKFKVPPDVMSTSHFYRNNPEKLKELNRIVSKIRKF